MALDANSRTSGSLAIATSPGYSNLSGYPSGGTAAPSSREWRWSAGPNNDPAPGQTDISVSSSNSGTKDANQTGTGSATAICIFDGYQYGTHAGSNGVKTVTPITNNPNRLFSQSSEARTENAVTVYYLKPTVTTTVGGMLYARGEYMQDRTAGWITLGSGQASAGPNTITVTAIEIVP
ncbi:MAG: hypothetical protein JWN98_2696 [Abditibacteriota bacterium]|nr:hypothetical protein [Abditibacteriota bacterium]